MPETEKAEFKLLNRLTGFRLIILPSGCWVKEGVNIRRYTFVSLNGIKYGLHVVSAGLFHNHDITQNALHKCDIEACCNPSHLYSGTHQDNANDRKFRKKNNISKGEIINRSDAEFKEVCPPEYELEFPSLK